jgi:magnesium chelatase subunit H
MFRIWSIVHSLGRNGKYAWLQGYDLGESLPQDLRGVGEKIVTSLKRLESPPVVARGSLAAARTLDPVVSKFGAAVAATEVRPSSLRSTLAFDERWGPTEWGPIPFLPRADMLSRNMEAAWGDLDKYRGLNSTASGNLFVGGLQVRIQLCPVQWPVVLAP